MAERAMNLPAYRRELRAAHEEFEHGVTAAADRLAKRMAAAEEAFTEDHDMPRAEERFVRETEDRRG